jgi:ATP-binding cassette subfamily B protein
MIFWRGSEHDIARDNAINRVTLRNYFEAMQQFKGAAILMGICFSITAICFGTLLPYLLSHVLDLVSKGHDVSWHGPLMHTLYLAAGAAILGAISNGIGLRGFGRLDTNAQNHIRTKVMQRLTHESASFYANAMTGSLTGNVIAYTNGYAVVQETIFMRAINMFLPLFVGLILVAFQSLLLAGLLLLIAVGIAAKIVINSRSRAALRRARKDAGSALNGFVGDVIANNATVRTFAGEQAEQRGLDRQQFIWRKAAQANLLAFGKHYTTQVGSVNVLQVVGVGVGAWLAARGHISLGLAVFAVSYFQRMGSTLLELGPVFQNYQGSLMDAAPISEILMSERTVQDVPHAKQLRVPRGEMHIQDVTYGYEADRPLFAKLNLHIPAGQSVGVVGRSGGGKTTLTNLLLRFDDIASGSIEIDGQDIAAVTQASLRQSIAYVPQDPVLFHRSIRENIAYGNARVGLKRVIDAARQAHIWDVIQAMPNGLDTLVGERGVKLSGGQRQRVAIARAIIKDAPILIFDEATSALDSESEQYIQASLDKLIKNRTSIVIAHRLSTIQKMDRIIVLDNGKIVEDGSHRQLIKQKGLYASLWAHQSGGFIE